MNARNRTCAKSYDHLCVLLLLRFAGGFLRLGLMQQRKVGYTELKVFEKIAQKELPILRSLRDGEHCETLK